jgi:hypothetical protein
LVDGEADNADNDLYWALKNGQEIYGSAGLRLWADEDDKAPQFKADTQFSYELFDFSFAQT